MNDYFGLDPSELEKLIFTVEASLKITRRHQFFLWAQGNLQSFLPHETLVCAHGDIANLNYHYECFSREVLPPAIERSLGDPAFGLLPRLIDAWGQGGLQPISYGPDLRGAPPAEFSNVLAHGPREIQGEHGSFFAFLRTPNPLQARDRYLAELLMPYLHMALCRMLANERATGADGAEAAIDQTLGDVLSRREMQVLQWVRNGKTNPEIGQILSISPLTVKNHVQKILRKLNVTNRAQAVGKGASYHFFARSGGRAQTPGEHC